MEYIFSLKDGRYFIFDYKSAWLFTWVDLQSLPAMAAR